MSPLLRRLSLPFIALALACPASAQQDSPAAAMPADVFSYLELDAGALDRGLHQLDLVGLLEDPEFYDFFAPLFAQLGADPARPIDSLFERAPIQAYLAGHAAIGLRGFRAWVERPDGSETRVVFGPDSPIDARALLDIAGLFASAHLDQEMGREWQPEHLKYEIGIDAIAVLEPGPALRQLVHDALANAAPWGPIAAIHADEVAGRPVTHISFDLERTQGVVTDLYADLSGERWLLATTVEGFTAAAALDPAASLASRADFVQVHQRMTSGDPVVFGYTNAQMEVAILRNFLPPILGEAAGILGLDSYRGSGFALSMTEGGVRESFGCVLDGAPGGVFRLLEAMPGGIEMTTRAPAGAAGLISVKFDPAVLFDRCVGLLDELLPGTGARLSAMAAAGAAAAGFDLRGELLDVLGDEISLVSFPPAMALTPDWLLAVDVKDEAAAARLLAKLQGIMRAEGAPVQFVATTLEGGVAAQSVKIQDFPLLPPVLAITHGRLLLGSSAGIVAKAANQWGSDPAATMAANPVFQRTMRGLAGGDTSNLALLAYLDLRQVAPPVLGMTLGMAPAEFVDVAAAPEIPAFAAHLGGVAMALRNDGHGLTLDTFSPLGVMIPAVIAGVAAQRASVAVQIGSAANDLNSQAWYQVHDAGQDSSVYLNGLGLATAATRMEPDNHWYLNTLGVAQYRCGHFEDALATLHRCDAMNRASDNRYDPASDTLFQAMCLWQLGQHDEARQLLAKSDEMVGPSSDAEILAFYQEAQELIGG